MSDMTLSARVEAWIACDPEEATREELRALLNQGAWDEVNDRFAGRLEFGTAGLRAVVGAGPNRMNAAVVLEATRGLVTYLLESVPDAATRGIVLGYDGRTSSEGFAEIARSVITGAGFRVHVFEGPVPTPFVGYAAKELGAAAGIMITASHNPPEYNGYKVYAANAAQIVPPQDSQIASAIAAVGDLRRVPRMSLDDARAGGLIVSAQPWVERYFTELRSLPRSPGVGRDLTIVTTALHGVGDVPTRRALREAGFERVHSVVEQAAPDGRFPTVRFPNPEEPGAMDLALALARSTAADLVIANDPDADRLALAVRRHDGEVVQLTGNDVGCLLGAYLLAHTPRTPGRTPLVVTSLVSSPMIGVIAAAHGARWEETLTGFKWIANRSLARTAEGFDPVLGYEEALGYSVGTVVRDKDGVSAALLAADMAAYHRSQGNTLLDALDLLAREHGLFLSRQVSDTKKGREGQLAIQGIMDRVRRSPPRRLGGHAVLSVRDLERGIRTDADGREQPLEFGRSNVIALDLEGGHRVMLRPSGTEPKIKYYFDVRETVFAREHMASARARGEATLASLVEALLEVVR